MKKLLSIPAILLFCASVKSQNTPNPYASIGKKAPNVLTMTNGAYDEFLLKEPLVLINGDAIDRKTGELVYSKEKNPELLAMVEQKQKDKFRFLSIDPLTKQYPFYSPYQYAGNTPIQAIDLDGLEPAYVYHGTQNLVIVIQGYNGANPEDGKTQAQNNSEGIDISGLGGIIGVASKQTQVVVYSSSNSDNTTSDIAKTLHGFKEMNPEGKVVVVGHSLGAENAVELVKENKDISIDLFISVDATDLLFNPTESTIPSNIKNVINYFQTEDKRGIKGTQYKEEEGNKTTRGVNKHISGVGGHTELDNALNETLKKDVNNFIIGKDPVNQSNSRKDPIKNDSKNETFNQN